MGEERGVPERPRPLRGRIGQRHELRHHVGGGAPGWVVEIGEIVLHGAFDGCRVDVVAALVAGCRSALVGVGYDQARIDRETDAADELSFDAGSNDAFEHLAENIVLAEALVAGTREGGVIGNLVFDTETAEPTVGRLS